MCSALTGPTRCIRAGSVRGRMASGPALSSASRFEFGAPASEPWRHWVSAQCGGQLVTADCMALR